MTLSEVKEEIRKRRDEYARRANGFQRVEHWERADEMLELANEDSWLLAWLDKVDGGKE